MSAQVLTTPPARRATSVLFCVLLGVTIGVVPTAGADPADPTTTPARTRATVRYELTGAGVAGYVTYQTNNGQAHATNAPLPWSLQLDGWKNSPWSLSAQSAGPGSLTCSVVIDGKVANQNTATGDPARVVCVG